MAMHLEDLGAERPRRKKEMEDGRCEVIGRNQGAGDAGSMGEKERRKGGKEIKINPPPVWL
jgi:hypothetical protein